MGTGNPYLMHGNTFEWDDDKAAENLSAHRVSFEEATLAVDDPFGIESPDARPFTDEERAKAKRVPRIKTLRRALRLTQEEFAARYKIPLGTLRDWEQGRSEPDQPARAYLHVIAHDPEGVRRALQARKTG